MDKGAGPRKVDRKKRGCPPYLPTLTLCPEGDMGHTGGDQRC